MAMTGQEFGRILQNKYDKSYSGYFSDTQLNRFIKESWYRAAELKYRGLTDQKEFDELRNIIRKNFVVSLSNSCLHLDAIQITNATAVGGVTVVVTITTAKPHHLVTGQTVTTSGIAGLTPAGVNGTYTVTVTSTTTFTYSFAGAAGGSYTANTGIVTPANSITNYYHYLTSKILVIGTAVNITAVTTGATTTVTAANHNLRTGDTVVIESVGGVTGINATHTSITVLNKDKFRIGTTSGTYTSGGTVQLQNYNYVNLLRSDQKPFVYSAASADFPKYEIGDGVIFYTPATTECTIDYLIEQPMVIDVADTVVDLEQWYSPKFLYYLADQIVLDAGAAIRDQEIQQSAAGAIVNNP